MVIIKKTVFIRPETRRPVSKREIRRVQELLVKFQGAIRSNNLIAMKNLIGVWEDYASNYTAAATVTRDYTRVKPNFTVAARQYPQDPDKMTRTSECWVFSTNAC